MGKKKTSKSAAASTPPPATPSVGEHSLFFDCLVELVPARFYLPSADADERPWFQGLSKAAKASAKKETRLNLKKARRDRLDPDKNSATTLDLLKQSIRKEDSSPPTAAGDSVPKIPDERSVTYEELRQRLRRKIEELRGNRNTRAQPSSGKDEVSKKDAAFEGKCAGAGEGIESKRRRSEKDGASEDEAVGSEAKRRKKDAPEVDLAFGHVRMGEGGGQGGKRKGLSKRKELEEAERLRESMRDPEKGGVVREKHAWKAAVSRAAGGKVHDDPRLIKESMKKAEKRRAKSAEKWRERVEATENLKAERQKKRACNIGERVEKKRAKRIEKREKKLMRSGFKGPKEGYINDL